MDSYVIPADDLSISEETIKKSRFITFLAHTDGVSAAREFVLRTKMAHPNARHHCYAFVAGSPADSQQFGFSDDGEPSGTAGKPMLAQLAGSQMGEITAIVVRYYGGIQLGTGGLVKAYGGGVQRGLQLLKRKEKIPMRLFSLSCAYAQHADIERLICRAGGRIVQSEFLERVSIRFTLPCAHIVEFTQTLSDFSRGVLTLTPVK